MTETKKMCLRSIYGNNRLFDFIRRLSTINVSVLEHNVMLINDEQEWLLDRLIGCLRCGTTEE